MQQASRVRVFLTGAAAINTGLRNINSTDACFHRLATGGVLPFSLILSASVDSFCIMQPPSLTRWVFSVSYRTYHVPLSCLTSDKMNITIIIMAVFLPVACLAAAAALMRLFNVKDATIDQAQAEAERRMLQFTADVKMCRRVRAGPPSNAVLADFPRLSSLSPTRIRFPLT